MKIIHIIIVFAMAAGAITFNSKSVKNCQTTHPAHDTLFNQKQHLVIIFGDELCSPFSTDRKRG